MDITSTRINKTLHAIQLTRGQSALIDQLQKEQDVIEKKLSSRAICSRKHLSFANSTISDLEDLEKSQPYSPSVSKVLSCFIESIVPSNNDGFMRYMLKAWTKNPKLIGSPSAEGYVYAEVVGDASGLIAVKVPQKPEYDQLSHEYVIGKYALNALRNICPHFLFILGKFLCNPPIIEGKKLLGICSDHSSSNNLVTYLILENLNPSVSIGDYVHSLPDDLRGLRSMCSSLYQVLRALKIGMNSCGFVHNDLHSGNVLMRELKDTVDTSYLKYEDGYLMTDGTIATIIDFGRTRAILDLGHKSISVGPYLPFLVQLGVEPDAMNEFYDIYKLLCFLLLDMQDRQKTVLYDRLLRLFRFFNKSESVSKVLEEQWDSRFSFPLMSEVTLGFVDFIKHFEDVFSDVLSSIFSTTLPQGKVLSCDNFQCLSPEGIRAQIEKSPSPIKTLDEFMIYVGTLYHQDQGLTSHKVREKLNAIGMNISPEYLSTLMEKEIVTMSSLLKNSLYPTSINSIPAPMRHEKSTITKYESGLSVLVDALSKDEDIHKNFIILKILFACYPELNNGTYARYTKVFHLLEKTIRNSLSLLSSDAQLLKMTMGKKAQQLYPTLFNIYTSVQ